MKFPSSRCQCDIVYLPNSSIPSPSDQYQVMFFDGFMKKLKSRQLSKWTRENEQRFGVASGGPGGSGLQTLPTTLTVTAGPGPTHAPAPAGFVPEVLETKRKRKTNPIVEELLGPKRARRQVRDAGRRCLAADVLLMYFATKQRSYPLFIFSTALEISCP